MGNTVIKNTDLKQILAKAQLPALPQSAIRLLELSRDPQKGPAEFAVPIESDPGLTGQVLKFVNSSYFGFTREISSIKLAITMVGVRTIKNFALWNAVFSLMPNPRCGPFDLKVLWQDSLRRGLFARTVGKVLGLREAEEPFSAALLQDMAVPLLAKELPEEYKEMFEQRQGGAVRLSQLERERFGWDHAEAAAMMAQHWNLPEEFARLVSHHPHLEQVIQGNNPPPGLIAVALSALTPSGVDEHWFEGEVFQKAYEQFRTPASPAIRDLFKKVDEEYAAFAPVMKMSAPARSLFEQYEAFSQK